MKYWDPGPLRERNATTGTWQMLAPRPDGHCYTFGANDSLSPMGWSDLGRKDDAGDYVFNLWRPYACCRDLGEFLFSIDF